MAILPYLDDWLVISPTQEQAIMNTATLLSHVDRLGSKVNSAMRACLSPKRVATILQLL